MGLVAVTKSNYKNKQYHIDWYYEYNKKNHNINLDYDNIFLYLSKIIKQDIKDIKNIYKNNPSDSQLINKIDELNILMKISFIYLNISHNGFGSSDKK